MHGYMYVMYGKLSEHPFNVSLLLNCGKWTFFLMWLMNIFFLFCLNWGFCLFARMLFCSLKNALPYSLAKCSPEKILFWKRAFFQEIILPKDMGEQFWETKRAFSQKCSPTLLWECPFCILLKKNFVKRAFYRGMQECIFKSQLIDNRCSQQLLPN